MHATELLVQAVSLGKDTLEGVESLKELSQELEQKKEVLSRFDVRVYFCDFRFIPATSFAIASGNEAACVHKNVPTSYYILASGVK